MSSIKRSSKKKEKQSRFAFFSELSPERKAAIFKYSALAVTVFTLFTLISVVSYLFTW